MAAVPTEVLSGAVVAGYGPPCCMALGHRHSGGPPVPQHPSGPFDQQRQQGGSDGVGLLAVHRRRQLAAERLGRGQQLVVVGVLGPPGSSARSTRPAVRRRPSSSSGTVVVSTVGVGASPVAPSSDTMDRTEGWRRKAWPAGPHSPGGCGR